MAENRKRILVIKYRPLREYMHCISAFAAIRNEHKDDEITLLTEESLVRFSKFSGFFDKVWLDAMPEWTDFRGVIDIIRRLRRGGFHRVYDLQNNKRTEWYFRLIGFKKPEWSTRMIDWCSHPYIPARNQYLHIDDLIASQLRAAGVKKIPTVNISNLSNPEFKHAMPDKFVMLCCGGKKSNLAHKWDVEGYGEVIDWLEQTHGIKSVLVGDDGDDFWINDNVMKFCLKSKPINFSGKTGLRGIINVASKALFCIGNDTTPTHMAALAGCKTIMLCSRFSPADMVAPKLGNIAVIEEPMLENLTSQRVITAIEEFGLK